jgi:hypothetical protein
MSEGRISRIGALSGALFVVMQFAGVAIGSRPMVTLSDSSSKIVQELSAPVGSGAWVGSYLELMSLGAFAVFAATLFAARRERLATAGLVAAGVYVALTAASLVVAGVLQYRAGRGLGATETLTLFDLQSGLFIASWAAAAGVLALVPLGGWLRRSALAIAVLLAAAVAAPKAEPAQLAMMLFFAWVLTASVVLARRPQMARSAQAVPAGA